MLGLMIKILMGGMVVGVGMIGIFEKIEEMCSADLFKYQFLFSVSYCTKSGANPSN